MTVVATRAVANHFAMDTGAASDCMVPVLEDQCRSTLTQRQARSVGIEWAAGAAAVVFIAAGHHAQSFPCANHAIGLRRLRTPGQHQWRLAAAHAAESFADSNCCRSTSNRMVDTDAAKCKLDGNMGVSRIAHCQDNRHRRNTLAPSLPQIPVCLLYRKGATHCASPGNPPALATFFR